MLFIILKIFATIFIMSLLVILIKKRILIKTTKTTIASSSRYKKTLLFGIVSYSVCVKTLHLLTPVLRIGEVKQSHLEDDTKRKLPA